MPIHKEKRVLPYSPAQLYGLVIDIEHYPEFLPWGQGARVRTRQENLIVADLIIGFKMFRERFTSRMKPAPAGRRIDVTYHEGPFKYLDNHWVIPDHTPRGLFAVSAYLDSPGARRVGKQNVTA